MQVALLGLQLLAQHIAHPGAGRVTGDADLLRIHIGQLGNNLQSVPGIDAPLIDGFGIAHAVLVIVINDISTPGQLHGVAVHDLPGLPGAMRHQDCRGGRFRGGVFRDIQGRGMLIPGNAYCLNLLDLDTAKIRLYQVLQEHAYEAE